MKKIPNYMATMWRPAVVVALCIIALGGLLAFSLGSLVPGYAPQEVAARQSSMSLTAIINNPVYAPHKLLQYAFGILSPESDAVQRFASGMVGAFSTAIFYLLVRKWFRQYVALLATLLFFTSSWFLGAARLATPTIMMTLFLALVYIGIYLRDNHKPLPWILATVAVGLGIYVPGFIWLIAIGMIWQFRRIRPTFERLKSSTIIMCSAIIVLMCAPLVIATLHGTDFLFVLTGLPHTLRDPIDILRHIGYVPISIFIRTPPNPTYWLAPLALLDFISIALFIFGAYSFARHWKLDRTWQLIGIFVLGAIWIGISGAYENILIMMPFVYIVIAGGINWLLESWFSIFPRNPIARAVGSSIVALAVVFACNYHITKYFLAWPSAPATQATFVEKI